MHFREGAASLQLFTTIATLGTPQDITVQELRSNAFFRWIKPRRQCCARAQNIGVSVIRPTAPHPAHALINET